jgi:hypothetical protein
VRAVNLLDGGPDMVQVWPEVEEVDDRRNVQRVPGPTPVEIFGRMQPVSSDESAAEGQQTDTLYRFISRDFPAGPWAWFEWDGRPWDIVGEPKFRNGSPRTRHVTTLLRARVPMDADVTGTIPSPSLYPSAGLSG